MSNAHTDRIASVTLNSRQHSQWLVIFGHDYRGEFVVSHAKPSRTYKTEAGARRAAAKWEA